MISRTMPSKRRKLFTGNQHIEFSIQLQTVSDHVIISLAGILHWITITVAVVLLNTGGGGSLQKRFFAKEVVSMISIDTVIAVITLVVTAVGLGLQLASYINTKNDRPSSKL